MNAPPSRSGSTIGTGTTSVWRVVLKWAAAGAGVASIYTVLFMTPALVGKLPGDVESPVRASMLYLFPAWALWAGTIGDPTMRTWPVYGAMGISANALIWGLVGAIWKLSGVRPWLAWPVRLAYGLGLCAMLWSVFRDVTR